MDTIAVTGIRVWAHHGVLEHERALGQTFVVDVRLDLDLGIASASDDLDDTYDYGALAGRVHELVVDGPHQLLETVAGRVLDHCLKDARVQAGEVTVHKPDAPFPVAVDDVAITLRRRR
jgi:dihydroneopterin aldolase